MYVDRILQPPLFETWVLMMIWTVCKITHIYLFLNANNKGTKIGPSQRFLKISIKISIKKSLS
jgi:hypothetical protein